MLNLETYFDAIDDARVQRAKELSEIKMKFSAISINDPLAIRSKAAIVLTYANWEGFYNQCVDIYLNFLTHKRIAIANASWLLLTGALSADFEALRARNHSLEAKREFVTNLEARLVCGFEQFDRAVVMSRSNLDFGKLRENLTLLNLDYSSLQRSRIRLDKEVVGWRHAVAHGDPPDLSSIDISDHVDFTAQLLLTVSDLFQEAILKTSARLRHPSLVMGDNRTN